MKRRLTLIIVLILFIQIGFSQTKDSLFISNVFHEIMVNGNAYDNLHYLCKKIGPRLSGSDAAAQAVQATALMLKEAGADTVYLQPCMVPHWVRGEKESGYILQKDGSKYSLHLCALGNSVGTLKAGVKGTVIEVKSMEQLQQLGEKNIKGRIVFFNIPMNEMYVHTFKAYSESGVARWDGPTQASRYGAIAAVVRSLASNADDYPHTGVTGYNDSFPKIPAIAISTNDANWLSNKLIKDKVLNVWFKTSCAMLPDVKSYNVIGEIKGTEFPQEIITVGGHLDSWDLGEGAQDDGAGCVQSIEVLRTFKALGINGYRPKRTIRAVLFMNEENGSKGADAYFDEAKIKKEQHVFAVESDAGGFSPRGFGTSMSDKNYNKLMQWKSLFENYDINQFSNDGEGSDIGQLKTIGASLAELRPDSQRYFDVHHAVTDNFESVSKRELNLGAFAMAAFVYLVSEYGL